MDPRDYEHEYDEEPPQEGRVLWGRVAVLGVALVLMFVLGRCTAGGGEDADEVAELESRIQALVEENTDLEAELEALEAGGSEPTASSDADDADDEDRDDDGEASDDETDGDEDGDDEADDGARTHEVEEGEYLYTLAEQYYGDGARWTLIADANNVSRDDPVIRPGMVLEIPPDPEGD